MRMRPERRLSRGGRIHTTPRRPFTARNVARHASCFARRLFHRTGFLLFIALSTVSRALGLWAKDGRRGRSGNPLRTMPIPLCTPPTERVRRTYKRAEMFALRIAISSRSSQAPEMGRPWLDSHRGRPHHDKACPLGPFLLDYFGKQNRASGEDGVPGKSRPPSPRATDGLVAGFWRG